MTNGRNGLAYILCLATRTTAEWTKTNEHRNVRLDVKANVRQLKYCNTSPGLGSFVRWRNDRHRRVRILMKISALLAACGKGREESGHKRSTSILLTEEWVPCKMFRLILVLLQPIKAPLLVSAPLNWCHWVINPWAAWVGWVRKLKSGSHIRRTMPHTMRKLRGSCKSLVEPQEGLWV